MKQICNEIQQFGVRLLLLAVMIFAGQSAWGQTISFTEEASAGSLNGSTITNQGFSLTITDVNEKISVDGNTAYFGTSTDNKIKFDYRLKTGGKSSSNNMMTLTVPGDGKLTIYARTGSNSATDRNVVVSQNDNDLLDHTVLEIECIEEEYQDPEQGTLTRKIYTPLSVNVKEGTVTVTYPVGAINFYGFDFKESGESKDTAVYFNDGASKTAIGTTTLISAGASDQVSYSTVKINGNKNAVNCIVFKKSLQITASAVDYAIQIVPSEGEFKQGDKLTVSGCYNNTDTTKTSKIQVLGAGADILFTTNQLVNGRTSTDSPVEETYTLTKGEACLYLGRSGNTTTYATLIKVVRSADPSAPGDGEEYGSGGGSGALVLGEDMTEQTLAGYFGKTLDAQLQRTLYKDGGINTICLPFSLSEEQLVESPLKDYAKLQRVSSASVKDAGYDSQSLDLTLTDVTSIEAGVPYIISWTEGEDIVDPLFENVTITTAGPAQTASTGGVAFRGTFTPKSVTAGDKGVMFVGSDGQISWPETDDVIKGFRCWFSIDK